MRSMASLGPLVSLLAMAQADAGGTLADDAGAPLLAPVPRLADAGTPDLHLAQLSVGGLAAATLSRGLDGHPYFGPRARERLALAERDGLRFSVSEVGPTARRSLDGYLDAWRVNHGCVARVVKGIPLLTRAASAPPQLTFGGTCKAPVRFLTRVVLLDGMAYELGVEAPLFLPGGATPPPVDLDAAMRALLERTTLAAPAPHRGR